MKIKINEVEYGIKFGYKATRILADLWGCEKISEVDDRVRSFMSNPKDLSFEQMDQMGDFFLSAILAVNKDAPLTRDDLMESLFDNPEDIKSLIDVYLKTQPKQGNEKAPERSK